MSIQYKILENQNNITKGVLKEILPEIVMDYKKGVKLVQVTLPSILHEIVTGAPEYGSLIGGQLRLELGIPDASSKIARMIVNWTSNIQYNIKIPALAGHQIKASFKASLFKANFSEVINTDDAKVYDRLRGYDLPWLQWLVFYGNIPIIDDYAVEFRNTSRSRTGGAVMASSKQSWHVPASYAGTIEDNWITRSISSHNHLIEKLMAKAFQW